MKKMIFFFSMIVFLLIISPVNAQSPLQSSAQSPFKYFLWLGPAFPDKFGDSRDPNHMYWIEVISFKHEQVITGTGRPVGLQLSDLVVVKRLDKASIELNNWSRSGNTITQAKLHCILKSGTLPYNFEITLKNVTVRGIKISADSSGYLEEVTLGYGSIAKTYHFLLPTGKASLTSSSR